MKKVFKDLIQLVKIRLNIETNSNMIEIALFLLMCFTLAISVMLGHNISSYFYFGLLITFYLYLKYRKIKTINRVKRFNWGEEIVRERKFEAIGIYFSYIKKSKESHSSHIIDNQTWSDLNMDEVFSKIDRTITTPGENFLYNLLRIPIYNISELEKRDKTIEFLKDNDKLRESLLSEFLKLDKDESEGITNLIFGTLPEQTNFRYFFTFLFLLGLGSVVTMPFIFEKSLLLVIPIFIFNTFVSLYLKNYYSYLVPSVGYLSKLLKSASIIRERTHNNGDLSEFHIRLKNSLKKTKKLVRKTKFTVPKIKSQHIEVFVEYFNYLFLIELRGFYSSLKEIKENIVEIREIYKIIGELDAYLSIASFKSDLKLYCKPKIVDKSKIIENNMAYIRADELFHPLVDNAVANSFKFSKNGIIVTGSNMAGKSTFLRTIGVNALFAQTIYLCLAKYYESIPVKIISSISQVDNITKGKSFYFTESERLLEIINSTANAKDVVTLCLIDELLKGTNSFERLNASEEILNYISNQNSLSIIATHDIDLAVKLSSKFECYHFVDNVDNEKGLDFDYKMKKGISSSSNAIKLLEFLKYPEVIYKDAYKKSKKE